MTKKEHAKRNIKTGDPVLVGNTGEMYDTASSIASSMNLTHWKLGGSHTITPEEQFKVIALDPHPLNNRVTVAAIETLNRPKSKQQFLIDPKGLKLAPKTKTVYLNKAKVLEHPAYLELLKGLRTISSIGNEYNIPRTTLYTWKKKYKKSTPITPVKRKYTKHTPKPNSIIIMLPPLPVDHTELNILWFFVIITFLATTVLAALLYNSFY